MKERICVRIEFGGLRRLCSLNQIRSVNQPTQGFDFFFRGGGATEQRGFSRGGGGGGAWILSRGENVEGAISNE